MPKIPLQLYVSNSLFSLTSGLIPVGMSLGGKRSPFTELGQSVELSWTVFWNYPSCQDPLDKTHIRCLHSPFHRE